MLLSVGVMVCPAGPIECARMGVVSFFGPLQKLWSRLLHGGAAHELMPAEARRLRSRIRSLQNQVIHQQEVIRQLSEQLQMLHAFRRKFSHLDMQGLPAEIIGRDTSMFRRSVIADAGTGEDVRADSVALVDSALIGRVAAAWLRASRVMLISDPGSAVPVLVTRTREQGILQGNLDDQAALLLQFASRFSKIRPRDVVVTSGVGGVFPKGIVVGTIASCVTQPGALFKRIAVRPAIDLSKLERVVILRRPASASRLAPGGPN